METYEGRLVADGFGNLLADEGDRAGDPVAYDEGHYIFVEPGEPSHNERHHQQFVGFAPTVDETQTDDPELVNAGGGENMHHFGVLEDDDHYDEEADNHTRLTTLPDKRSVKASGHTEAYTS